MIFTISCTIEYSIILKNTRYFQKTKIQILQIKENMICNHRIKEMIFKPVNMPEVACKELGVAPNTYGILVEKHRATRDKKVVQVDLEYWRLESVELVIRDE